ncbi:MAG: NACHT domain-containing protein [Candidatus Competibacteraceae bacterium]
MANDDYDNLSREELIQLLRKQQDNSGIQVERDMSLRDSTVVGGDQHQTTLNLHFGVYEGKAPDNATEALHIYRQVIAHRCGDIPLTGLDRDADDAGKRYQPLALERVYVDLDTTTQMSDQVVKQALASGQLLKMAQSSPERAEDTRPLSALEAVALHRRLVLLGNPGAGKTTFINRLCLGLAGDQWADLEERWPEREWNRLPVLVILRDFAGWLRNQEPAPEACASLLWVFIQWGLNRRNLGFAQDPLWQALQAGRVQLFLDGLDEVPPALRRTVLDTVDAFANSHLQVWMLVTCRVASYEQVVWQLPGERFPELRLAPFDRDKIERFVAAWYEEMAARWNQPQEHTRELAARLNEALRRPDLARLAPNPLLLTVMALVHTHDKVLPDHQGYCMNARWKFCSGAGPASKGMTGSLNCWPVCGKRDRAIPICWWCWWNWHSRLTGRVEPAPIRSRWTGVAETALAKALATLHPKTAGIGRGVGGADAPPHRLTGGAGARSLCLAAPHLSRVSGRGTSGVAAQFDQHGR